MKPRLIIIFPKIEISQKSESLRIGQIAYHVTTLNTVKVRRCDRRSCTTAIPRPLDSKCSLTWTLLKPLPCPFSRTALRKHGSKKGTWLRDSSLSVYTGSVADVSVKTVCWQLFLSSYLFISFSNCPICLRSWEFSPLPIIRLRKVGKFFCYFFIIIL